MDQNKNLKKDWIIVGTAVTITILFYSFIIINEFYRTCKGSQINLIYCMIFIVGALYFKRPKKYEQYFISFIAIVNVIFLSIFLLCDNCGG
jgi:ABC-type uncharacterized transport system permease subunit